MALTLDRCTAHVQLALGRAPSARTSVNEIVNAAGQWFYNAFEWGWLERPEASLNLVSGQSYVTLPTDFGRIVEVRTPSINSAVRIVSLKELSRLRQDSITPTGLVTYAALAYAAGSTTSAPSPRLEIYPAPSSTETGGLLLFYHAGWVNVATDTQFVQVPGFCEGAFLSAVKAYAMGWENYGGRTLSDRLIECMGSEEMVSAMGMDQSQQSDYGVLHTTDGAIGRQYSDRTATSTPWLVDTP